ncbi:MAG: ClpXP protease specificity-enhancing factor [Nitrosomonadales bacterium]|nr:ClpXP protease specificity-enhancing factor [Nitrosomonadales bacterium]
MSDLPTKPYLIRAIYDWCADSGLTPYLAVRVDKRTLVPMAFVKEGEIVLNLSMEAVHNLQLGNEEITCDGRFGGVPHAIVVPVAAVTGIFAKENGQGLAFQGEIPEPSPSGDSDGDGGDKPPDNLARAKPQLRIVK